MPETITLRLQFLVPLGLSDHPGGLLEYTDTVTITGPLWVRRVVTMGAGDHLFATTKLNANILIIPAPGVVGTFILKGAIGDQGVTIRNDQPLFLPINGAAGTTFYLQSSEPTDLIEYIEV